MTEYRTIKNQNGAELFKEITNSLHDGYITSIEYKHNGINAVGNYIEFDYEKISSQIAIASCNSFQNSNKFR